MPLFHLTRVITLLCVCIPSAAFSNSFHTRQPIKSQYQQWRVDKAKRQRPINMMESRRQTETLSECAGEVRTTSIDVMSTSSNTELIFDEQDFHAYHQAIEDILSKNNVLREFKRDENSLEIIKALMLDNKRKLPRWGVDAYILSSQQRSSLGNDTSNEFVNNTEEAAATYAKQQLEERREMFINQTGITSGQHKLATTLLSQLADHCARTSQPRPLYVAWEKLLEAGMTPLSRVLSTYLYVLGLDEDRGCVDDGKRDVTAEVAMFHDAIYEPTEKTITLLVKSLVRRGDAAGAEALLDGIDDGPLGDLRHRTTNPILKLYCQKGEIAAALRLYQRMRTTSRVKMDAETYCGFISSVAEFGYFRTDSQPIDGAVELGYCPAFGSALLDELIADMATDVLDISEDMAKSLQRGFAIGFEDKRLTELKEADCLQPLTLPCEPQTMIADRVTVDIDTGICPATNSALRLIVLEDQERSHVHDTLIKMARVKSIEYTSKLAAKGRAHHSAAEQAEQATQILSKFSDWLDCREGKPYTAIVDGANVAYFGWGRVQLRQLQRMVDELEKQGEHTLVVMPEKYTRPRFYLRAGVMQVLKEDELEIIERLREKDQLYAVPPMCLDDMYWMLASVSNQVNSTKGNDINVPKVNNKSRFPGLRPICITNDRMRDHRLELLDERSFRRWCCSHIVNYNFTGTLDNYNDEDTREITFQAANVFSDEIQCNECPGGENAWHFPVRDWAANDRFCLRLSIEK